jgi:hypothetical protein
LSFDNQARLAVLDAAVDGEILEFSGSAAELRDPEKEKKEQESGLCDPAVCNRTVTAAGARERVPGVVVGAEIVGFASGWCLRP